MPPIAEFVWTSLVIELTPGPNMTYLAVLTLAEGRRAGLAAVAGVALGLAVIGLLSSLGLGALIDRSPIIYQLLRIAGIGYLVWLAWDTWRGDRSDPTADNIGSRETELWVSFRNGLVTNLLNPKAALFYIAILPVYIDPTRGVAHQAVVLSTIYVAVATGIHVAIVLMAARARPFLEDADKKDQVRKLMALMLVAIAVWMAWATHR